MKGILKGNFLGINSYNFEGKTYNKALFLTVDDNERKQIDYVSLSDKGFENLLQVKQFDYIEIQPEYRTSKDGKGKWKY